MPLAGLRLGDLISLRFQDLGDDGITIRTSKTNKLVPIEWTEDLHCVVDAAKAYQPGNFYVLSNFNNTGLSAGAATSGMVFFFDTTNLGQPPNSTSAANAAYYWYVAAGTTPTSMTFQSIWTNGGCLAWNGAPLPGYAVLSNDSTVTGVASAPRPGPVLPSSP